MPTPCAPKPLIVHIPTPFPPQNSRVVPWRYDVKESLIKIKGKEKIIEGKKEEASENKTTNEKDEKQK
ncbi:hypothetical protein CR513_25121, partial [Mucuna pruriens]